MAHNLIYFFIIIGAVLGYREKSLSVSGAISACIVGILITFGLGAKGLILLGVFFVTSSYWSKYKSNHKKIMAEIVEKGKKRDYAQVLANGSLPAFFSLIYWLSPSDVWLLAFCISIAAANADTWASEIGSLSKRAPYHILTCQRVMAGTSGAISTLGTIASLIGSLLIAIASFVLFEDITYVGFILITIFGLVGSIIDTMIGASYQAKYKCVTCHLVTERKFHCHDSTVLISGSEWMNNDKTNFFSIFLATIIGLLVCQMINGFSVG